jgi:hypothetical protein
MPFRGQRGVDVDAALELAGCVAASLRLCARARSTDVWCLRYAVAVSAMLLLYLKDARAGTWHSLSQVLSAQVICADRCYCRNEQTVLENIPD